MLPCQVEDWVLWTVLAVTRRHRGFFYVAKAEADAIVQMGGDVPQEAAGGGRVPLAPFGIPNSLDFSTGPVRHASNLSSRFTSRCTPGKCRRVRLF